MLKLLNINQSKAVMANDRFIFLLAGAGTGKTRVIIERVKRLINEGVDSKEILIISFTRKTVSEIKYRLKDYDIFVTTFHGFCYQKLKPIDIVDESFLIERGFTKDQLLKIDRLKRNSKSNKLVKKYRKTLKHYNLFDYNDLELSLLNKLKHNEYLRNENYDIYTYIFIDEFQDTSLIQYNLLKKLIAKKTNVFCVGDPNQSIYNFRGANKKVIKAYIKNFNSKVYYLDLNYRSNYPIIRAANYLLFNNKSEYSLRLFSFRKEIGTFKVNYFKNEETQASYIEKEIRNHLKTLKQNQIAILYRNHYIATDIKEHLNKTYFEDINFLTVHQAKGLEFEVVFFIGLEEGNLPMKNDNIIEERNIFYVGLTRAKSHLYLCSIIKSKKPSRFINECFK